MDSFTNTVRIFFGEIDGLIGEYLRARLYYILDGLYHRDGFILPLNDSIK